MVNVVRVVVICERATWRARPALIDGAMPVTLLEKIMPSTIVKRSIVVAGHQTSVSLEDAFWNGLKEIGKHHNRTLSDLVDDINGQRQYGNLSSAIRLFVLDQFRGRTGGRESYGLQA
jgi:predicted DNA-binding ribbon-helix-helix protein